MPWLSHRAAPPHLLHSLRGWNRTRRPVERVGMIVGSTFKIGYYTFRQWVCGWEDPSQGVRRLVAIGPHLHLSADEPVTAFAWTDSRCDGATADDARALCASCSRCLGLGATSLPEHGHCREADVSGCVVTRESATAPSQQDAHDPQGDWTPVKVRCARSGDCGREPANAINRAVVSEGRKS